MNRVRRRKAPDRFSPESPKRTRSSRPLDRGYSSSSSSDDQGSQRSGSTRHELSQFSSSTSLMSGLASDRSSSSEGSDDSTSECSTCSSCSDITQTSSTSACSTRSTRTSRSPTQHNEHHPSSVILQHTGTRIIKRFNTEERSYTARMQPDISQIRGVNDYVRIIEDIWTTILAQLYDVAPSDRVRIMMVPLTLRYPIVTPPMRFDRLTLDHLFDSIARIYQSNQAFILDASFRLVITVIKTRRGGARKWKRYSDYGIAREKKRSVFQVTVTDGLCLPAAILLGKAVADGDTNMIENARKRRKCFTIKSKEFVQNVLGHGVDEAGCEFEDIPIFQNHLGTMYSIRVFSWAPQRKRIWPDVVADPFNNVKIINLLYHENHFDLIKKLPGFFDGKHFCHSCNKCYSNSEQHSCTNKCHGCYRINCPDESSDQQILCNDCYRLFPGKQCFSFHKWKAPRMTKTLCERATRCKGCGRFTYRKGKAKAHVCGEVYCKNCKDFVPPNHRCYIKPLKDANVASENLDPDETPELSDSQSIQSDTRDDSDTNNLDEVTNCKETDNDDIVPPDQTAWDIFNTTNVCYYDIEAIQNTGSGLHEANLVIAVIRDKEIVFEGDTCINDFGAWAVSEEHKNYIFVAHNAKNYDSHYVINYLVENTPIKPIIVTVGASLLLLKIKSFNIRFIDSCCFLMSSLRKLPKMFKLEHLVTKGNFPHRFNAKHNYHYSGPLPDISWYDPDFMATEERAEFLEWYATENDKGHYFEFWNELKTYCLADCRVVQACFEKFRTVFHAKNGIDPAQYCTIASACNAVFRKHFLKSQTIAVIPPNGYKGNDKQSYLANIWLSWTSHHLGVNIRHIRNGGEVQIALSTGKTIKVDGYYEDRNMKYVYEFLGCFFHGCNVCYSRGTFNPLHQCNMEKLFNQTQVRLRTLRNDGYHVSTIWEHQFLEQLNESIQMQIFSEKLPMKRPLNPREAFFGGRTNGIQLYCKADIGHKIRYYDINSLYPFVNKSCVYPVGHPIIKLGHEIDVTNLEKTVFGLFKGTILPPQHMLHPILPYRAHGRLTFPLCASCVESLHEGDCDHDENSRQLDGTWCTIEVVAAMHHGYRIIKCDEVWHFEERSTDLLAPYIKAFTRDKQHARGKPEWVQSEADMNRYLDEFEHHEGIRLDPGKMEKNPAMYAVTKLMLNSFWGKFGQRPGLPRTEFIDEEVEFWKILKDGGHRVMDITFPSDSMAQIQIQDKNEFVMPGINTNSIIAAFTTSHAILELFKALHALGNRVLYFDTISYLKT